MVNIRELHSEHEEVLNQLQLLEKEMNSLILGQVLEGSKVMAKFPIFIQQAILPHFSIEENVCFPLLAKGSPSEMKLREELVADHLFFKEAFFNYLMEVRTGQVTEHLINLAKDISFRLATHAKKEDSLLIPCLRKWLQTGNGEALREHAPSIAFFNEEEAPKQTQETMEMLGPNI